MSKNLWLTKLWPMSLSDAYNVSDELFGEYISSSVVKYANSESEWCLEIVSDEKIYRSDNILFKGAEHFSCEPIPDIDWLAKCFENFKPITVGKFFIYGSHSRVTSKEKDKICLQIDAANAFGSGEHPTTQGCLKAIQAYFNPSKHLQALDLGCGSCILGMALAKLGCKKVFAYDNDHAAVSVSKFNIEKNKVQGSISVHQNKSTEFTIRKYDIVVANILAKPLISLADSISSCLKPDGLVILSGFTEMQREVEAKYIELGLKKVKDIQIDEWITSIFTNG